jgi:precorrin-4/cobalt-precorrin-4 C11-methyltransferase
VFIYFLILYPPATTLDDIVKKVRDEKITRTAIVIISDVIDPKTYEYSKLYDKKFSHGYRKAKVK